jgi:DNA-binding CsgD family transcriptional regulator
MTAVAAITLEQLLCAALTPRELQILQATVNGHPTAYQLARHLHISHRTVNTHLGAINRKLGTRSRLEAVVVALRAGAIHL